MWEHLSCKIWRHIIITCMFHFKVFFFIILFWVKHSGCVIAGFFVSVFTVYIWFYKNTNYLIRSDDPRIPVHIPGRRLFLGDSTDNWGQDRGGNNQDRNIQFQDSLRTIKYFFFQMDKIDKWIACHSHDVSKCTSILINLNSTVILFCWY